MTASFEKAFCVVTLIFVAFVCFYNLDFFVIRSFDEGRNAVNAFEMYLNPKSFFYTTYEKNIDTWNTKPPLLIWTQVIFMKILVPGEWAIRLPSAVAGLGIAYLLLAFFKRNSVSLWATIFSLILLFSNWLFSGVHVLRTGDYDALFTFFSLGFVIYFFYFSNSYNSKDIFISIVFLTFSILTKGVVAFFFLPGIFIYLVLFSKLKKIVFHKDFWKVILIPLVFGVGYYFIRELVTPGYLKLIWINELAGRYTSVENSGKIESNSFYLYILRSALGLKVLFLALIGFPVSYLSQKYFRLSVFLNLLTLTFLLIVSLSKTKLYWYIAPIIPLISATAGLSLVLITQALAQLVNFKKYEILFYIICITFIVKANVMEVVRTRLYPKEYDMEQFSLTYKLRKSFRDGVAFPDSFTYLDLEHYKPHYLFYSYLSNSNYKFKNFNEYKIESFDKIATEIPILKKNIEYDFPIIKKEEIGDLSFYSLGEFSKSKDKRILFFNEVLESKIEMNNPDAIQNPSDPTSFMVIKKFENEIAVLELFFRSTNREGNFDYDIIKVTDNWDYLNYNGYSIKFIHLRNAASHLELKAWDAKGKMLFTNIKDL